MLQCSSFSFPIQSSWRVSHIIELHLYHLDPTLVDHLRPYLSVCPIRHPLWLSMSHDSQGSTAQGYSPHKCFQNSSCSAFNVMVAAFPWILLSFHHPCMFIMHIPVTGASWKVTLIIMIPIGAIPSLSKEVFLLEPPSNSHLIHETLGLAHPLLFIRPRTNCALG